MQDEVRTLDEVLQIVEVWEEVVMQRIDVDRIEADCIGDLEWLDVILDYLDGATPEQLQKAWYPDEIPENYVARPLQRQNILEDLSKAVQHAWRFRESPHPVIRDTGGAQLDTDLLGIDAYLWLLKDEQAIQERRAIFAPIRALSWICQRYSLPS